MLVDSYTLVFHYERLAKHLKILDAPGDPGSIYPQWCRLRYNAGCHQGHPVVFLAPKNTKSRLLLDR